MKKNDDCLTIAISNLITLGVEQCMAIRCQPWQNEGRRDYDDVNITLDLIDAIGMDRCEAWDIISDLCFDLIKF